MKHDAAAVIGLSIWVWVSVAAAQDVGLSGRLHPQPLPVLLPQSNAGPSADAPLVGLTLAADAIWVDTDRVLPLQGFGVPAEARHAPNSPILDPLRQALADAFAEAPTELAPAVQAAGGPIARLYVDPATPFGTFIAAVYTADSIGVTSFQVATHPPEAGGQRGAIVFGVLQPPSAAEPCYSGGWDATCADRPPRLLLAILPQGFQLMSVFDHPHFQESGLWRPVAGCPLGGMDQSEPVTVCLAEGGSATSYDGLDYRRLYERLVAVAQYPQWAGDWTGPRPIAVTAAADVPVEALVRTLDAIRTFREADRYPDLPAFESAPARRDGAESVLLFPDIAIMYSH